MRKFYSRSTGGFYSEDVHGKDGIPNDGFEITDEEWQALLQQQSLGKQIVGGAHGGPVAIDPAPAPGLLVRRDNALRETDWLVSRHRDEIEVDQGQTTLTRDEYSALQTWRRTLRDITSDPLFPHLALPECPV